MRYGCECFAWCVVVVECASCCLFVVVLDHFVTWEDGQNTCHLGDGVVNFEPAWTWLSGQVDRDIWITAEQDNADDRDLACQVNSAFLSKHIAEIER